MKTIKFTVLILITSLLLFFGISNVKANTTEYWKTEGDGYAYFYIDEHLGIEKQVILNLGPNEVFEYSSYDDNVFKREHNGQSFNTIVVRMVYVWMSVYNIETYYADFYNGAEKIGTKEIIMGDLPNGYIRKVSLFELPEEQFTTIDKLPSTLATNTDVKLGYVYFHYNGKELITSISYEDNWYNLKHYFTEEADMTIFDTIEAYFQNVNGKPQIIINHSELYYLKDILEAPEDEKPAFVPHTIWDLKSNDLNTISDYVTYAHLKQNDDGVIIAYVYIDDFIIDKMLSATLRWTSRVKRGFIPGLIAGKYTEWETYQATFTNDDYLTYKNLTMDWQNYVPFWNVARGIYQLSKTYDMPRIDEVDYTKPMYNVTKNELESYFTKLNSSFTGLNPNPRYKVWAFALESGVSAMPNSFGAQTEIYHNPDNLDDPMNFHIFQLTYITNGKLYQTLGDHQDLKISVQDKLDGVANEKESNTSTLIFIGIVILYLVFLISSKAYTTFKKFTTVTFIYILIIVGVYLAYVYILPQLEMLTVTRRLR